MKLIVGLGNPGKEYENTRHNTGFIALDNFAETNGLGPWKVKSKFNAEIIETTDQNGGKLVLAKPQTFMNNSGQAVRALKDFYKLKNDDITVVHDELTMPMGQVQYKTGGSSAGNNGIGSIIEHIGEDFHRVRIGIHSLRAYEINNSSDFVLSRLNREEIEFIKSIDIFGGKNQ
jgi:PTH1 family peptidyl-tRNA hydrolase